MGCLNINIFYPSCNTEKYLEAVKKLLETRECNVPSTECILEPFEITMSSNSTRFNDRFFTHVDRATIGSPDSGSVTDIFGAIHIDKNLLKKVRGHLRIIKDIGTIPFTLYVIAVKKSKSRLLNG